MIKRLLGCVVVSAILFGPVTAHAEEVSGTVLLPNPGAVLVDGALGITEGGSACDPDGPTQGIDGFWIDLPSTATEISLTTDDPIADLSLFFYDAACSYMSEINELGAGDESGEVPAGSEWVIVDMMVGANASFTVSF